MARSDIFLVSLFRSHPPFFGILSVSFRYPFGVFFRFGFILAGSVALDGYFMRVSYTKVYKASRVNVLDMSK